MKNNNTINTDEINQNQLKKPVSISLDRCKILLEAIPDIVMEVDNDKVYTWANQAGLDFFGSDVIGKEASSYFEGEQETYSKVEPIFMGSEQTIYLESWQRRQDGQKRLLAWWCRTLKDSGGRVIGAISTARDITKQRQAEKDIEEKFAEIKIMNEAMIGRELKMIEVKKENEELKKKLSLQK